MIKLFSLKQQKKDAEAAGTSGKKSSAALLRITKDHNELQLPSTCELEFDDADDLQNFRLVLRPNEGLYAGGRFVFSFKICEEYPHKPPKVHCDTRIYHPNIDNDGNVCLNVLREDWRPVLNLQSVVYGLLYLFLEPNPDDPLNKKAAEAMMQNKQAFEKNVRKAMSGGVIDGVQYDRCA